MNNDVQYSTAEHNRLSDRDMLLDLLVFAKGLSHLYDHAIMESTSSKVHNTFEKLQHHKHESARALFDVMRNHGWYSEPANKIQPKTQLERVLDNDNTLHPKSGIGVDVNQFARRPDSSYAAKNATRDFGHRLARRTGRSVGSRHNLMTM